MVLWMELLMGAPHPASTVDLWVGAGVRERVLACFLAGWGDQWLSPPLFHRLFQLPLQHLSWLTVRDVAVAAKVSRWVEASVPPTSITAE